MKYTIIISLIALTSIAGNGFFIHRAVQEARFLDKCAQEFNVYRCVEAATPAVGPKVVYKDVELLPPPAV